MGALSFEKLILPTSPNGVTSQDKIFTVDAVA